MKNSQLFMRKEVWLVAAALLGGCGLAQAASTDVASSPLFTSATASVKPNVMFLLDDSGSMAWDFLPDNAGNSTSNMCRGSGTCNPGGDVNSGTRTSGAPFLAQQFNNVYYDPTVTYSPPLDFDGTNTTYKSYNNTGSFLWSAVKVNPFPGGSTSTKNLTTSFPEEVWCDGSQSGPTDAVHCRRNLQTNPNFSIGLAYSGTTATVTLANHGCSVVTSGDTVTISGVTPAGFNGTKTITAVATNTFTYTVASGLAAPAAAAGQVMVSTACNIPITKLSSVGTTATAVFPTAHGCVVGDTIKISGQVSTSGFNSGGATVTAVPSPNTLTYTTAGSNLTPNPVEGSGTTSGQFIARSSLCPGTPSNYSTSTTVPPLMQGFPQGIFTRQVTLNATPYYYTISPNEYCTDENLNTCQATVSETIGSPATAYTFPATVRYCVSSTAANFRPADIGATGNGSTTGCSRAFAGSFTRARYGYFTRVNIVSGTATYPKASSRTDCAGATSCTYNEEMSNFANWYAYYRTRIMMVKSSAGIAFNRLNTSYRVGFNTMNATSSSQWLANAPFDNSVGGQESQWYTKLYAIAPNSSTPSRTAISRIGRYYAGMKSSAAGYISDDPVQYSCQQNLTFFITDGYWNGTGGIKLDGTAMGDQDGQAGVARPFFDAFAASGGDGGGTLADVAYYYYFTDLRTPSFNPIGALGLDVTQNNVPPTTKDPNTAQHMVTFTMGLGLDSTLIYKPGYDTSGTSPDYNAVVNGSKNWPVPVANDITAVDDLWHTAVNGRGTYFSAKSPSIVTSGLLQAFASLSQRTADESAAATSTPNIVPGDNFVFSSKYTTVDWFGETTEQEIDASTGALIPTINWSAQAQLDLMVSATSDTRTIFTFDGSAPNKVKNFLWANLTAAEQAFFNGTSGGRNQLSQWSVLTAAQQNNCDNPGGADCGQKLVNYLRGQRAYETPVNSLITPDSGNASLFRHRPHILGDIVSAEAVYVRLPIFNYGDLGYSAFKNANTSRQAALYVAANDGMLHALNANTGVETWAYIPSVVMPNMWQLARFDYSTNHLYFVDGTPTAGDICTSNCGTSSATWATILVGGFNAGGRGYYALDITNPASPKALWELKSSATCIASTNNVPVDPVPANTFSDCDIGLSFGNPVITKRADGKWVVLVTSGYNNISPPGTGGGYLYVVDAVSGAILNKIATLIPNPPTNSPAQINAGNTTTPSGLARINAFVSDTITDNTSLRVYGGDLNGNLWRFDSAATPNTLATSGNKATLLAILGAANALGTQGNGTNSITTKPELGEIVASGVGTLEMVYVGTGRYLGTTDLGTTTQESFYGIKDPLGTFSGYGAVHSSPNFVQQTLTEVVNSSTLAVERFTTSNTVDYTSKNGWFIDFNPGNKSPGERSNTDPVLSLGILSFTTNAPDSNACNIGGKSYRYFLNYTSGGPLSTSVGGVSGVLIGFALSTRPVVVEVNGKLEQIINTQGLPQIYTLPPLVPPAGGKRIFWREINP